MKKLVSIIFVAVLAVASFSFAADKAQQAPKAQQVPAAKAVGSKVEPQKAVRRSYTRQEIRSMDILDRPNRPGHFYGNAVRRRHGVHNY